MGFFEGLQAFEIVMLFMGVLLFIVLVVMIIIGREVKAQVPLFAIAVLTMGYPSIRSFTLDKDGFRLEKVEKGIEAVRKNPADSAARKELAESVKALETEGKQADVSDTNRLVTSAEAYILLGDTAKARRAVDTVLKVSPKFIRALDLRDSLTPPPVRVDNSTKHLETNPQDTAAKNRLIRDMNIISKLPSPSADDILRLAKAHSVLKDTAQAVRLTDSALKINPHLENAKELKIKLTPGRLLRPPVIRRHNP